MNAPDIAIPAITDRHLNYGDFVRLCEGVKELLEYDFGDGFDVSGRSVSLRRQPRDEWAFGHKLVGMVCTIYGGAVRVGGTVCNIATGNLTLSGATEWVFIQIPRANVAGSTLEHGVQVDGVSMPVSDSTNIRWPLLKLTALPSGAGYDDDSPGGSHIRWRGDINLDLPTR